MLVEIRSYRGIDRADINLSSKVTLIVGENGKGKTSFLEGVQAVCTAEPNHFSVKKADAPGYVNRGAKEGTVTLRDENGTRRVTYPSLEVKSLERAATTHRRVAMGLVKFHRMSEDELAKALETYASQQVDRERLSLELTEAGLFQGDRDRILDTVFGTDKIPGMGWDAGDKWASTEATKRKALFKNVAGCTWGVNQGVTFTPEGWELDLVEAQLEDLEKAVVDSRESHEQAIRENAFAESEIEQLQRDASEIENLNAEWHQANLRFEKSSREAKALEEKLTKAKADAHLITCENCGIKGTLEKGKLVKKNNVTCLNTAELAVLERQVNQANQVKENDRNSSVSFQNRISSAKMAAEKLKEAEGLQIGAVDENAIDEAKIAIAQAETRLRAFKAKKQGTAYHNQIVALVKASEALGNNGLRKRVLIANLKPFNDKLAEVCRTAGWGIVSVDPELQLRYDGGHWKFICESELFRLEVTMQLAIALLEESPLVVIDRANLLEKTALNQLFNALRDLKIRAVVAMSRSFDKDGLPVNVPDLGKLGRGMTYWVEKSTIVPLHEKLAEKVAATV